MKRKVINIVRHTPTGAEVPMIIKKVNEKNEIEDYEEYTDNREYFTLEMLSQRWDKDKEDILPILDEYEIPAHVQTKKLVEGNKAIDVALFFVEYIYALEKKLKLSHSKLKPRIFKQETEH